MSSFYLNWWQTGKTKLGIYFNDFGLGSNSKVLSSLRRGGLNSNNGLSCSVEENYHFENIITDHPVENSKNISDHIIKLPLEIPITGLLTSITTASFLGGLSFSQLGKGVDLLIEMREKGTGLSLTTCLLYGSSPAVGLPTSNFLRIDNLAIKSLDIPRDTKYGKTSIRFSIVFKQINITSINGQLTTSALSQAKIADGVDL